MKRLYEESILKNSCSFVSCVYLCDMISVWAPICQVTIDSLLHHLSSGKSWTTLVNKNKTWERHLTKNYKTVTVIRNIYQLYFCL
jgi:hypothetical protein